MSHAIAYSSLMPPNLFILAALIAILLAWRWRRLGLGLATAVIVLLYLLSAPLVAYRLLQATDTLAGLMPVVATPAPPGAIVVLSADLLPTEVPGQPDTVGPVTLERLAEAARLQRRLGLPVLVSGGPDLPAHGSLADAMARSLDEDFRVPVRWREDRSRTTYENALYSAAILRRAGVPAAFVVTQPWHMARALWSFAAVGYPVRAAPTPGAPALSGRTGSLLPQVSALHTSQLALHEMLGLLWYAGRYSKW
jgi:uncharacterized SAM-binding protein YcdF (DUF218 family)